MTDTITAPAIRTRAEIQALKESWLRDGWGDWDLEDADGFEAHREELLEFHNARNAQLSAAWTEKCLKVAEKLGCPGNAKIGAEFHHLNSRIQWLEERVLKKLGIS